MLAWEDVGDASSTVVRPRPGRGPADPQAVVEESPSSVTVVAADALPPSDDPDAIILKLTMESSYAV